MAPKDDLAISAEKALKNLLAASKQQGRRLKAEREYAVEAVGVSGTHRTFQEIAKTVSEGDENVATGYQRQMIVSVKSIEAENLPGNVFRDGVKQIISDIMKVVNADVLLSPEMKGSVQDVANQLIRYADRRGKVGARAAATAAGLAKRVRSSLADSLSGKRSILLRGLGYLLKAPDRKEARAKTIADARLDATQGALDNRAQGENDPELMRSAASRIRGGAGPASPEGKVLVDIRTGINKLVAASDRTEDEYQSDREDAGLKAEEGQGLFESSSDTSPISIKKQGGSLTKLSKLGTIVGNIIPALEALGVGALVIGAAWLGWKVGEWIAKLTGLGNSSEALKNLLDQSQESFSDTFAAIKRQATSLVTRGESADKDEIRGTEKDEIERAQKLGAPTVEYPTGEMGFDDRNAAIKLNLRKARAFNAEIARLQKETPGGISREAASAIIKGYTRDSDGMFVRPATKAIGQSLPAIDTRNAPMRPGFVEGGTIDDEGALETLPEGRPISPIGDMSPTRATSNDSDTLTGVISAKPGELIARTAKGETVRRTGHRNSRNNNPGNIRYNGDFAKSLPASIAPIGTDGEFAVFATKETGKQAQARLIFEGKNYKNLTIPQMIKRYSPSEDGNDVAKYTKVALGATGGDENTKMKDLSPSQRVALQNAMEKQEGGGKVTQMAYAGSVPPIRSGNGLGQASTALDQQKTATNNIALNMIRNAASPPAPTQSTYVPYRVNPRDDSRQAISSINAT